MARKCKKEKKDYDEAGQQYLDTLIDIWECEARVKELEFAANGFLDINLCIDSEGGLDEQCVIDNWAGAHDLLEAAEEKRSECKELRSENWHQMNEVEFTKGLYHDCLERQGPR